MALNRNILERQLENAQTAQTAYEAKLGESDPKARKRDPKWRSLDADRRAVATRLYALKKVEERDAALVAAKQESAE